MGLDSYIYKKKLIADNLRIRGATEKPKCVYEETQMLYLRKANQIHHYVVREWGDGVDNCQPIYLSIDNIRQLRDLCQEVLEKSHAKVDFYELGQGWSNYAPDDDVVLAYKAYEGTPHFEAGEQVKARDLKKGDMIFGDVGNLVEEVKGVEQTEHGLRVETSGVYAGEIIPDPSYARDVLPTATGFFFGSLGYDEFYIDTLKAFIRQADETVADYEREITSGTRKFDIEYYYLASW